MDNHPNETTAFSGYSEPDATYAPAELPPANPTVATVKAEIARRRTTTFDIEGMTATITDADTGEAKTWDASPISGLVARHLLLVGLVTTMRSARYPDATYNDMLAGTVPGRARPKVAPKRDPWREAVAVHLMDIDADLSLDDARTVADAYSPAQMKVAKGTVAVVRAYADIMEKNGAPPLLPDVSEDAEIEGDAEVVF